MNHGEINWDAFSSGQVVSKLWMLEEWERCYGKSAAPEVIWLLCGWYGLLSFLIYTRDRHNIEHIRSFDVDENAIDDAHKLNNTWTSPHWRFRAFTADICKLEWDRPYIYHSRQPDWVINSSCEHLPADQWWSKIPMGQKVILQGTDMEHTEHVNKFRSVEEMQSTFPLTTTLFAGEKRFAYLSGFQFTRFMLIGTK